MFKWTRGLLGIVIEYLKISFYHQLSIMPKINKSTIKTFKNYPTLKTFKYENSEVYHFVMYVGTILKEINNKKVMSGNFGHSLQTRVIREAEQLAKNYYKDITSKINSGELSNGQ